MDKHQNGGNRKLEICFIGFNRFLDDFTLFLFVLLLAVASLQVISRYLFKIPFPWTEELARFLLVWVCFLGAASVTRRKLHITVEFFSTRYPMRTGIVVKSITYGLMVLFLAVLFWGTIVLFRASWEVYAGTIPWLRISWVYSGSIIGVGLMLIIVLRHFFKELSAFSGWFTTAAEDAD